MEFDPGSDIVTAYVERTQLFLEANEIAEAKHVAVFLSAIGAKAYALLRNLLAPVSPKEKTFKELVDTLKSHYEPKPLTIAERFHFHRRAQRTDESVKEFAAELRRLSTHCEFGTYLDEALRDRFVCGLGSETTQKRLLTESELTFAKAVEIAHSMEAAAKNARKLQDAGLPQLQKDICKVTPEVTNGCYRCGKPDHRAAQCPFRGAKCHNCGKQGHIRRMCRQPKKTQSPKGRQTPGHQIKTVQEGDVDSGEHSHVLYAVRIESGQPLEVDLTIEGKPLRMEVDTGAAVSLVSEKTHKSMFAESTLQHSSAQLRTYSGEPIPVLGQVEVEVCYGEQRAKLPLLVVAGEGPCLMGRDWLMEIRLNWREINTVQSRTVAHVLDRHRSLFEPGLGTLQGYEAKIHVDPTAQPRFCKARAVPFSMKSKVEEELKRLQQEGILEPIQFADWAAPIVPVLKSDGKSLRICGDFKLTVNRASKLDRYPIPKIEDLFATLMGGKAFSKLDMSQAYQQLPLEESSKKYTVVNTHRGLFQYNRLPFGISSAPGIFQRVMESLLSGIPGVVVYLDDILVTGPTEEEHLATLDKVLQRLSEAGLRLRKEKCVFLAPSVVYLGHRLDAQGLHPVAEKVKALQEAPSPKSVSELKSYLGLLTYYSKFLPNLSSELAPLYKLLKHNEPWHWKTQQKRAFERSKNLLLSSQLLVHFDPSLEIRLACDASAYGIGAVLSHQMPDGTEKPVGFVSRTLTEAEKKYSQIEKEGLACVYGVKRFHSYLFGHHFTLQTDHQPLQTLFNESKAIPPQASSRIQRWALTLASYEYTIACRKTTQHANADAMSRLPLSVMPTQTPVPPELVLMVERLEDAPISATQIAAWTRRDALLSRVHRHIAEGWPDSADDEPYWTRRLELSAHAGCIVWGGRVVVPPPGRESVLIELHGGHPGVSRMKSLARTLVWWPGMDQAIEEMVKQCSDCQQSRPSPPAAPLHPWQWPTRPWTRLHIDYAGPMEGKMYLIVIDAHSKWIEAFPMTSATALTTIQHLRVLFAQFGVPEVIVSDNGSQFVAAEFQSFCRMNGIRHIQIAPYHPSSNGLAERAVKVFKQGIRKLTEGTVNDRIARSLFQYRITPHTTTGVSPAEMLMGRRLRSRLDLLKPSVEQRVEEKQRQQQADHDKHCRMRSFSEGEKVFVKNNRSREKWLSGHILKSSGPVSFKVQLQNGKMIRCHQDQLRSRFTENPQQKDIPLFEDDDVNIIPSSPNSAPVVLEPPSTESAPQPATGGANRYPSRIRRPPERFADSQI